MPPNVLNNIIANEEATADAQISRKTNAQQALGVGGAPMSFDDYTKADNDLNNNLKSKTDQLRQQYGAIGTESQQPPPIAQPGPPLLNGNSIWDVVTHLFGGGGTQTPQPPPPPPPPPDPNPPLVFDPKTNSLVPAPQ